MFLLDADFFTRIQNGACAPKQAWRGSRFNIVKGMQMATEAVSHGISESASTSVQPELLVSSVLHLMSHYTVHTDEQGCKKLAAVIERHLDALAELPGLAPVLRATCRQLAGQWAGLVERAMQPPEKQHRLLRFVASGR